MAMPILKQTWSEKWSKRGAENRLKIDCDGVGRGSKIGPNFRPSQGRPREENGGQNGVQKCIKNMTKMGSKKGSRPEPPKSEKEVSRRSSAPGIQVHGEGYREG